MMKKLLINHYCNQHDQHARKFVQVRPMGELIVTGTIGGKLRKWKALLLNKYLLFKVIDL